MLAVGNSSAGKIIKAYSRLIDKFNKIILQIHSYLKWGTELWLSQGVFLVKCLIY